MKVLALLIAWILSTATRVETENKMTKLKIPYSAKEVGHCYDRLKQTLPVYQKGISDIRSEMESNNSFEQRLQKVLDVHAGILKAAQTQESPHSWEEPDVYLCVLYDMLEAMYVSEADGIVAKAGALPEKRKNLDALVTSIPKLPFGSPQYQSAIRPRLEQAVSNASKKLEAQK